MHSISDPAFKFLQAYLEKHSGIVVAENKRYLMEVRLEPLLRDEGLESFDALVDALQGFRARSLGVRIVESMTTHETLWFRDDYPFRFFRDVVLKEYFQQPGKGVLRVWSAACATGQEPYSLSILVEETQARLSRPPPRSVKIMATDISDSALTIAREGVYDSLSLRRGMDESRLRRFFVERDGMWKVRAEIAARISFRPCNLLESFAAHGKFEVIFCRNVLIYFSSENKQDVIERLLQSLQPGGYLILGASESIPETLVKTHSLERVPSGGGIYRKPPV